MMLSPFGRVVRNVVGCCVGAEEVRVEDVTGEEVTVAIRSVKRDKKLNRRIRQDSALQQYICQLVDIDVRCVVDVRRWWPVLVWDR